MTSLRIDIDRLMRRIRALGGIGALEGGGVCRLALTDEDKTGRDLVVGWMRELGLRLTIDRIGNVVGVRPGKEEGCDLIGGTCIIAPAGEVMARCQTLEDELVIHACDLDSCREIQDNVFNFALHREPESYGLIAAAKGIVRDRGGKT